MRLCNSEYTGTEGLLGIQQEGLLSSANENERMSYFNLIWAEAHLVLGWLSFIVCRAVRAATFCYGGQDDEEDNGWDHPTEHRHDQDKIRVEIIMDLVEDFIERILISFLTAELIRP